MTPRLWLAVKVKLAAVRYFFAPLILGIRLTRFSPKKMQNSDFSASAVLPSIEEPHLAPQAHHQGERIICVCDAEYPASRISVPGREACVYVGVCVCTVY